MIDRGWGRVYIGIQPNFVMKEENKEFDGTFENISFVEMEY
jgi:hypothetical protein